MKANKDKLFTAKVDENLLKAFKHACENKTRQPAKLSGRLCVIMSRNMGKPSFLTKKIIPL